MSLPERLPCRINFVLSMPYCIKNSSQLADVLAMLPEDDRVDVITSQDQYWTETHRKASCIAFLAGTIREEASSHLFFTRGGHPDMSVKILKMAGLI